MACPAKGALPAGTAPVLAACFQDVLTLRFPHVCAEYYPNCEVVFMGMANIHAIRNSFQYLRAVCSQMPDPSK